MVYVIAAFLVLIFIGLLLYARRRYAIPPANLVVQEPSGQSAGEAKGRKTVSIFENVYRAIFGKAGAEASPTLGTPAPAPSPVVLDWEDDRIPPQAKDRIRRILACLHEIESEMERHAIPVFDRPQIGHMRDQHLPKLVMSYINIPPSHRGEIFRKTGKSASFILNEGLDKMQGKVDEIMRNLAQHDLDAFGTNIRFIEKRYSERGDSDPFG